MTLSGDLFYQVFELQPCEGQDKTLGAGPGGDKVNIPDWAVHSYR